MRSVLVGDVTVNIDGGSIKIANNISNDSKRNIYKVGIAPILANVQVALGEKFSQFKAAVELSRAPLAFKETPINKKITSYKIFRLSTGKVEERMLSTLIVCKDIIVGVEYNKDLIDDNIFRKYVRLSALQFLTLGKQGSKSNLLTSTKSLSILLRISRESLIVVESAKNIVVKVKSNNKLGLDINYVATLDKSGCYRMSIISFDINEAIRKIDKGG